MFYNTRLRARLTVQNENNGLIRHPNPEIQNKKRVKASTTHKRKLAEISLSASTNVLTEFRDTYDSFECKSTSSDITTFSKKAKEHTEGNFLLQDNLIFVSNAPAVTPVTVVLSGNYTASVMSAQIEISEAERLMTGAPEGPLFDAKLLTDEEIVSLVNSQLEFQTFKTRIENFEWTKQEDIGWGFIFDIITELRSVLIHSRFFIPTAMLPTIATFLIHSIEDTRSKIASNGLLCLKRFLSQFTCNAEGNEFLIPVVQSLLKRCHGSGRFLNEIAEEIFPLISIHVSPACIVNACIPIHTHKNNDISKKSFLLICESSAKIPWTTSEWSDLHNSIIKSLHLGLKAKTPEGRNRCRVFLKQILEKIGEMQFYSLVGSIFPNQADVSLIKLELNQTVNPKGVSSSFIGQFRKVPATVSSANSVDAVKILCDDRSANLGKGSIILLR